MILVTGGTGFIGSFLLRELVSRGEHVRATKRPSSSIDLADAVKDQVEWVDADLLDLPSLEAAFHLPRNGEEKPLHVYHSAAIVSHLSKDSERMMRTNVEGTANIVNLCLAHGARKLLHVSSIAALGRTLRHESLDEASEWSNSRYNSPYGLSKFRSEREVWRGIGEGLNAVVVNPSIVLGPGPWERGSGRMFSIVNNGLKFYPPSATGFVDVRDVVSCMVALMNSNISGQRFIINAENRTMRDAFAMIARSLGKRPPAFKAGRTTVELALAYERVRSLTGRYPRYTRALARNSRTSYEYDSSKITETLDFRFRDLQETIEWVASEFQQTVARQRRGW